MHQFRTGFLAPVGSLQATLLNSSLTLTWMAPFSLDLTGIDPDITDYCVRVFNTTSSEQLHSTCQISMTEFTYQLPSDTDCHVYDFTVFGRNGLGRGEENVLSYMGSAACMLIVRCVFSPRFEDLIDDIRITSWRRNIAWVRHRYIYRNEFSFWRARALNLFLFELIILFLHGTMNSICVGKSNLILRGTYPQCPPPPPRPLHLC